MYTQFFRRSVKITTSTLIKHCQLNHFSAKGGPITGAVNELRLPELRPLKPVDVDRILSNIDLESIRSLELGRSHILPSAFRQLAKYSFPALESLVMRMDNRSESMDFLESIPGLRQIDFTEPISADTLDKLVKIHGLSLRQVSFSHSTCLKDTFIKRLGDCSQLETLKLTVKRTQGDAKEISIYTALRSIKTLKHLDLSLDTALWGVHPDFSDQYGDFDESDREVYRYYKRVYNLEAALRNSALDKDLALAIFQEIQKSEDANSSLQTMTVRSINGCNDVPNNRQQSVRQVFTEISRTWKVSCLKTMDGELKLSAEEFDHPLTGDSVLTLGKEAQAAVSSLWLKKDQPVIDWKKNWHSFPLRLS